jgi:hypothetical protein
VIKRVLVLALSLVVGSITIAGDMDSGGSKIDAVGSKPAISPRSETLDVLFTCDAQPARLELRVEIDGKTVPEVWDEIFAKLFAFYDYDGNGALDSDEAKRLPSAYVLRQLLWGQLTPRNGIAPDFSKLELNGDGKVEPAELADYYRRAGLGGVLVGIAVAPETEALTDALLKYVDTNQDAALSEREWLAAGDVLRKLDTNDDELVGPGELIEWAAYPGAQGSILMTAPGPESSADRLADKLPFIVLPLRTADRHWEAVAARQQKLLAPSDKRWPTIRTTAPAVAWSVKFDDRQRSGGEIARVGREPPGHARLVFSLGTTRFELRSDEGMLAKSIAAAAGRCTTEFAALDTNADSSLDAQELAAQKSNLFNELAAIADRDRDRALTKKEFSAWLDLQQRVANGHVLLTVIDHGAGLFELLDSDHDGGLSTRELGTADDRLKALGCVDGQHLDRTKLPRQLLVSISRGHPQSSPGKPKRQGPSWFIAMDSNGDGDVSRKEFTGPGHVFDQFDLDKDGLLVAGEVGRLKKLE